MQDAPEPISPPQWLYVSKIRMRVILFISQKIKIIRALNSCGHSFGVASNVTEKPFHGREMGLTDLISVNFILESFCFRWKNFNKLR